MADLDSDELDFGNFDGVDELDWSDVEGELKQNKEMLQAEAADRDGGDDLAEAGNMAGVSAVSTIDIDYLLDIPLDLAVQVGRRKMLIRKMLNLQVESVLELGKRIGEPLDILINEKLVARGEVVVQNEKFGLRITKIIDQKERMNYVQNT